MKHQLKLLSLALVTVTLLSTAGCGGGDDEDTASSANIGNAAGGAGTACDATYNDTMGYASRKSKYSGDGQCLPLIQGAESYRQVAIANCKAGNTTGATANYGYYTQTLRIVNSQCP